MAPAREENRNNYRVDNFTEQDDEEKYNEQHKDNRQTHETKNDTHS